MAIPVVGFDGCFMKTDDEAAEYFVVPADEYYGYQNALRIVRDRSLQQIEKSTADEHGYKFLRADLRIYEYKNRRKAWNITKSTPYSIEMGADCVKSMIISDFAEFYNYKNREFRKEGELGVERRKLTSREFVQARENFFDESSKKSEFLLENNDFGREVFQFFSKYEGKFIFEISRLSANYSAGVFEVSYWATDII